MVGNGMDGDAPRRGAAGARPAGLTGRGGALVVVVVGVVALVAALVVVLRAGPAPDVGAAEVARLAAAPDSPGPPEGRPVPDVPVRSGDLPPPRRVVAPVRLRIPAIKVTAAVEPVGVDARTNEFAVPARVDRVGWYRYGPGLDATRGSVVIGGHVDGAGQGPGAFFRLRELEPGDRISVTGRGGDTVTFRVVGREEYAKSKIPLSRYFARDGAFRLTLITCGGPFDERARVYRDNVVVTAVPL